jgi:serine/threonine-protein kinase
MIGTTIGKYRIVALLGRGATGIVYKGIDDTLDREVAIKVLNPLYAAGDILKRFRSEATTLAKLSHPEIATIHELLRTDTDLLMVMELVRGETLEALAERTGPMSPELAGHILDGILSALEHAHRAGIVHRDLKPANAMVSELGGVKIMDFGIARVRGAEHMTIDGCAVGTPAYMAPEQVLGEDIDGRADLYAVGLILYRLLTGKLPFDADSPMVMLQKQVSEAPTPVRTHRPDLPDWCDSVVQRALAKAPEDRFQTAEEFRAAVGHAIGLRPALDLAKALAVSAADVATDAKENQPVETVAISRSEAGLPAVSVPRAAEWLSDTASAKLQVVPAQLLAMFTRTRQLVQTRHAAVILVVLGAAGALAYMSGGTSTSDGGTGRRGETGSTERTSVTIGTRAPDVSPRRASSTARTESGTTTRSERRAAPEAPVPLVFRAKLVVGEGRGQRQEDARLSFAPERLSVAASDAPDDPVFSVAYDRITAIEHSRQPGWKPPSKWSRVIKIEDEVLETFGVRNRHEIALRTDSDVVVLRIEDQVVNRVLRTLKERTGLSPAS